MIPQARDLIDSTVYSHDEASDASALSQAAQQSTSSKNLTCVPGSQHRVQVQYFPPTQYSPDLSDSEKNSYGINSAHGGSEMQDNYPGGFPDDMQDQLPIGHPFNMSLKYNRAPAYPSQTSFSTPIKQRLSMSRPHDD